MMRRLVASAAATVALTVACVKDPVSGGLANLQYNVTSAVGPCGASLSVRFDVDGVVLAEEDFLPNAPPPQRRIASSVFQVPVGTHTIGAKLTRWNDAVLVPDSQSLWPDTLVTLVANQTFVRTVDLYCS